MNEDNNYNEDKINFKILIASQLNAIAKISRQEYYGGFWHKKGTFQTSNDLHYIEEYLEDTREQYSNAVECLHDIMEPKFDSEMIKLSEELNKKLCELKNSFVKDQRTQDDKVNYRITRRDIMRDMFRGLNKLLGRLDYFDIFEDNKE